MSGSYRTRTKFIVFDPLEPGESFSSVSPHIESDTDIKIDPTLRIVFANCSSTPPLPESHTVLKSLRELLSMAGSKTRVDLGVTQMEVEGEDEKPTGRFRSKRSNGSFKPAGKWPEHWKDPVHDEDGHSIDSLAGDRGEKSYFTMG